MPVTATSHGLTSGNQTSLTIAHTSDTNFLYVLLSWFVSGGGLEAADIVTGITFNGVALIRGGQIAVTGQTMEWWRLETPTAVAANVVISASSARRISAGVLNVSGWPSSLALHTFAAAGDYAAWNQPAVTVSSSASAEVLDWLGFNHSAQTSTAGAGQTEQWSQDGMGGGSGVGADQKSAGSLKAGAAPYASTSWTLGNTDEYWGLGAISFVEAVPVDTPIDYEDPCEIVDPRVHVKVTTETETLRYGVHPIRDTAAMGGFKEPRVLEVGPSRRSASDVSTGAWSADTTTITLADTDRVNRARSATRTSFRNCPAEVYLTSKARQLAGDPPRLIFGGKVYKDDAADHLVLTLTLNDFIGVDYSLFSEEKMIPQRFISASDFPNASAQALGLGVPIVGGDVHDVGNPPKGGNTNGIYCGQILIGGTYYEAVLVAGHAIYQFLTTPASTPPGGPSIWLNEIPLDASELGVSWWAPQIPGDTTWAATFGANRFTNINPGGPFGRDYTLILFDPASAYGLAVAAGGTIHFDCIGMEDVGDGSGAPIVDYFELYFHVMNNFLVQNYQSGLWLPKLQFLFADGVTLMDRIDEASFTTASTTAMSYNPAGYIGSFVIGAQGQRSSIRDIVKNFNFCGGCVSAIDDYGRYKVQVLNRDRALFLNDHPTLRDKVDILPGFWVEEKPDWQANWIRHQYAQNFHTNLWDRGFAPLEDVTSQARDGVIKKTIQFPYLRDIDTADAVAGYYLMLFADMPKVAHYARRGLCGYKDDLLQGVPITHYNGYGAAGYLGNAFWVIQATSHVKTMHREFLALDVEAKLGASPPPSAIGLYLDPDALEALYSDDASELLTADG